MKYQHTIGHRNYIFESLKDLLAKASPEKSGDALAGIAAENAKERVAAQMALADYATPQKLDRLIRCKIGCF